MALEGGDVAKQKVGREQNEEPLEIQPLLKLPAKLKDLKVKVSHVNSPSSFYVQFMQNDSQFKRSADNGLKVL